MLVGTKEALSGDGNCDPNCTPCVPVAGNDTHDLDRDGDGIACAS